ncbi:MAG TPA: dihydroneopterin aldolase [Gammaproteobacteria bacterium]|nr:dihydroneopterin aldolase [Gammaproteobacteria bacterium]
MTDIVFIRDLRIPTLVGIYDWERRIRQEIRLDIEMGFDISRAAASDDIADALDYKAVAQRVREYVEASGFALVEALAENIARLILEEFPVSRVRLVLNKTGAVRGARDVGVIIERAR